MILSGIGDWIKDLFGTLNDWLAGLTKFDERFIDFYNTLIEPLSEWVKLIGLFLLLIIVIAGVFALIKKMYKVVIAVGVIYAIFIGLSYLTK